MAWKNPSSHIKKAAKTISPTHRVGVAESHEPSCDADPRAGERVSDMRPPYRSVPGEDPRGRAEVAASEPVARHSDRMTRRKAVTWPARCRPRSAFRGPARHGPGTTDPR